MDTGHLHLGIIFIISIGVLGGMSGGWLFQRLRIPQVIGYIVIGVALGESGVRLISPGVMESFGTFNQVALGIIGFLVGGELKGSTLKKYGRQFSAILLGEGLGAFVLVSAATGAIIYLVRPDVPVALAGGLVLGAIASATDPASTLDVLWEIRARGILTTTIIAVVALDDALAMTLYGLGTGMARLLVSGDGNLGHEFVRLAVELPGAMLLGALAGMFMNLLLRWNRKPERTLPLTLGTILLVIGVARTLGMDLIMAAMVLGIIVNNLAPARSREPFNAIRGFAAPIYVLFFVLIGARLSLSSMPGWLWGIIGAYVACRTLGKITGAFVGARLSGAEPVVQKYTGMGIMAQGGVAVGLAIMAGQHMTHIEILPGMPLSDLIVFTITATTLGVQLLGPLAARAAGTLSGERGRDITDEDVAAEWKVARVVRAGTAVPAGTPLEKVLPQLLGSDDDALPVADGSGRLAGIISLDTLKDVIMDRDTWAWLVAGDVMQPVRETARDDEPLQEALVRLAQTGLERLPVLKTAGDGAVAGILERGRTQRMLKEEVFRRRTGGGTAMPAHA